jgi:hypothetical protein
VDYYLGLGLGVDYYLIGIMTALMNSIIVQTLVLGRTNSISKPVHAGI